DLATVEPSLAGPRRPQDRVALREAKASFLQTLPSFGIEYANGDQAVADTFPASDPTVEQEPGHEPIVGAHHALPASTALAELAPASVSVEMDGRRFELEHGSVVIAAITSCTNTSNPQVMVGAGLLAKNA